MDQVDVLRIEVEMDEEVLDALVICADKYPEMNFAALVRELLIVEARQIAAT